MILKRLVIPGTFVEAHLYFDFLWLIDGEGAVHALDLGGYIEARLNGEGAAAQKLFARNDRLVGGGGQARASDQTPDVQRLLGSSLPIEMSSQDVERFSYHFAANADLEEPLDVRFYSGRAFVGIPGALLQFNAPGGTDIAHGNRRGSGAKRLPLRRVFDEGTPTHIQCRFGSINLACGPEGGFYGLGALSGDEGWEAKPRKIVQTSFFTEVNSAGIGHVGASAKLHLNGTRMRNAQVPLAQDDQVERLEVDEVGPEDRLAMKRADIAVSTHQEEVIADRMYLTTSQALVVMSDGSLKQFTYAKDGEFLHTNAQVRDISPIPGRILATSTTSGRIIAECDEDVFVLDNWKWNKIFEEPVYSVRGYPSSRWYRQLVTLVAEERTELVFICSD